MKVAVYSIILFLLSVSLSDDLFCQSYCYNIGFENGTFTGWSGRTGTCCPITLNTPGLVNGRQTIITDSTLKDPNTAYGLRMIPNGNNYSVKLGNNLNGQSSESLSYTFTIDNNNALVSVNYAMVINESNTNNAQFQISVLDQSGKLLDNCQQFKGYSSATAGSFFRTGNILWTDWNGIYFDLSKYIGQTVTLELRTNGNGGANSEFCYVYAVPHCQPMKIITTFCENDDFATLDAPDGFDLYTWSTGQTGRTITINNPQDGKIYGCTMKSFAGCDSYVSTNISRTNINPQFTYEVLGCDTKLVKFYDVSTATNSSIVEYFWDFGDGKFSAEKSPTHQYSAFGGYNVSLTVKTSPSNCTDKTIKQVYVYSTPQVIISGSDRVCTGSSITLIASGADRYQWNTGDSTASINVTHGGPYEVTGYFSKGCPNGNVAAITVIDVPSPNVEITGVSEFCSGDKITLTASGANKYLWNTGETTPSITVFQGGRYNVSGSLDNGCTTEASLYVTEINLPIVINGNRNFCTGGSTTLTATGADSYEWSNGETTSTATFSQKGLHSVTGISVKGCRKRVDFELFEVGYPIVSISGTPEFCTNSNTLLTAMGATSYRWSTGATTPSITVIKPGTYQVIGYNSIGLCSDTSEITVTENPLPNVKISGNLSFCEGDSTILTASGAKSYIWNNGTVSPYLIVKQPGIYSVKGISEKGCESSYSVTVVQESVPLAITGNRYFCTGDSTQIIATGATKYLWSTGQTSTGIFIKKAGNYSVTGTSVTGCSKTFNFSVSESAYPNISITGKPDFCKGSYTQLTAIGATNFLWSTGETTATITVRRGGTFRVTGNNINSCSGIAEITVTEKPLPEVTITGATDFCENGNSILTAHGAESYLWNTGETTASIIADKEGYYTAIGTNSVGCSSAYTVYVTERKIDLKINNATYTEFSYCKGDSIQLTASGADSYSWSFGSNTKTVTIKTPGTYSVKGTNLLGCSKSITFTVRETALPTISLIGNFEICSGESTRITASGTSQYLWSTGETGSSISINKGGFYTVSGTDPNKCSASVTFYIKENQSPTVTITGNTEFCEGGSTTLTAQGALSYIWSNGQTTPSITVFDGGIYSVTGSSINGCKTTTSVNINKNIINLSVNGSRTICKGDSTQLIATGAETYQWSTGQTTETAYFNKPGRYSLTGYIRGCSKTITFDLTETLPPSVFITGNTSFCVGGSTLITANGATSYQWSTGETSPSVTIQKSGTYSVTGYDQKGCQKTVTVVITEKPTPVVNITGKLEFCQGTTTSLTASGATSYKWNTGEVGNSITINTPGVYSVYGTTAGCESSASVNITALPGITVSIMGNKALCSGDSTRLIASGANAYLWSTGKKTASIIVRKGGTYSVIGTNSNNCSQSVSVVVTETPSPLITIDGKNSFCEGGSTTLTAYGADSYLWNTGEKTNSITVSQPGNYFVVGNRNGCSNTASITVKSQTVNLKIEGTLAFCLNDSTRITASGADFYTWSDGSTLPFIYIKKPGAYSLTGRLLNGCSKTIYFTVSEAIPSQLAINGSLILCSGDSTRLTASGADQFEWSTGEKGNSIVIKKGGIYSVTGITAEVCRQAITFNVTEVSAPSVYISGTTEFCDGDSTTLTAQGAATYLWNNGATTSSIKVKKSGTYTVVGTSTNGCSRSFSVKVKALLGEMKIIGVPEFCLNDSTRLTANGADTYLWSTGETSKSIYLKREGNYTLTGFSTKGCMKTINFSVRLSPYPTISLSGNFGICIGEAAVITATGGDRYIWSTGDTARTIRIYQPGNYSVIGFNRAGCSSVQTFTIVENPGPSLIISGPTMICEGQTATLSVSGFEKYTWSTGDTTSTITITKPGTYSVTGVTKTGCQSTGKIVISDHIVIYGKNEFCRGSNTVLTAAGSDKYIWNTGDTTAILTVINPGIYSVTGYSKYGCVTHQSIIVRELEIPYLDIKGNTIISSGQSTKLTASGAEHYQWNTGDTTSVITASSGGIYTVIGTNKAGCSSSLSVKISEYPLPRVSISGNLEFCTGDSATLTAIGAYYYQWNTGEKKSQIVVTRSGAYAVTGSDYFGNVTHDTVSVIEIGKPTARIYVNDLYRDVINLSDSVVTFKAEQQPQVEYTWNLGDGSPEIKGMAEVTHTYHIGDQNYFDIKLTAINPLGCQSVAYQRIKVESFSPNTFTPNGDGINDLFMKGYEIKVYNRKGTLIYAGTNGWDGRYHGSLVPAETYFYVVTLSTPYNGKNYRAGYVTIMY